MKLGFFYVTQFDTNMKLVSLYHTNMKWFLYRKNMKKNCITQTGNVTFNFPHLVISFRENHDENYGESKCFHLLRIDKFPIRVLCSGISHRHRYPDMPLTGNQYIRAHLLKNPVLSEDFWLF